MSNLEQPPGRLLPRPARLPRALLLGRLRRPRRQALGPLPLPRAPARPRPRVRRRRDDGRPLLPGVQRALLRRDLRRGAAAVLSQRRVLHAGAQIVPAARAPAAGARRSRRLGRDETGFLTCTAAGLPRRNAGGGAAFKHGVGGHRGAPFREVRGLWGWRCTPCVAERSGQGGGAHAARRGFCAVAARRPARLAGYGIAGALAVRDSPRRPSPAAARRTPAASRPSPRDCFPRRLPPLRARRLGTPPAPGGATSTGRTRSSSS